MKDDGDRADENTKDENGHDNYHRSVLCITNAAYNGTLELCIEK